MIKYMSSPQQVIDFLKARGGFASLRELNHFPINILNGLQAQQYIKITGKLGCYEVHLISDKFESKEQEIAKPTQSIIQPPTKPKKSSQVKAKPKDKVNIQRSNQSTREVRYKEIRESILKEIKNSEQPMSALELRDKFPTMKPRAIAYHLSRLEGMNLVKSVDWNTRLWVDADKEYLLQKTLNNYIGRHENKTVILNILKSADQAMSVADIFNKSALIIKLTDTTLRKILQLFVNTGLVKSAKYQDRITYFALVNNQLALSHLNKLKQYRKRKLNSH